MAMTPTYALAHVFLPNFLKLKNPATVVQVIERKDKIFFDSLWAQAYVQHNPNLYAEERADYRAAVMTLPAPKELGEAYMAGFVVKKTDPGFWRMYLLEKDYVLKTNSERTILTERAGKDHSKLGEGPALTGEIDKDMLAFMDQFMEYWVPTKVTRK